MRISIWSHVPRTQRLGPDSSPREIKLVDKLHSIEDALQLIHHIKAGTLTFTAMHPHGEPPYIRIDP